MLRLKIKMRDLATKTKYFAIAVAMFYYQFWGGVTKLEVRVFFVVTAKKTWTLISENEQQKQSQLHHQGSIFFLSTINFISFNKGIVLYKTFGPYLRV